MKKVIALLIAALMVFSLAACNNTSTDQPSSGGAESSSVSQDSASSPDTSASSGASSSPDASSSSGASSPQDSSESPPAQGSSDGGDPSVNQNAIGFFDDGVDPFSRKTYDIVWAYMRPMALFLNIGDSLRELEPILNFKTTEYCANSDIDAMIQTIEIYADQGVDGIIIVIDASANMRIKEVLDDTGIPYIGILNTVRDSNGRHVVSVIGHDNILIVEEIGQWLYDNYKNYWGDIDTSKIALLSFDFSPNVDFHERHLAAIDVFNRLFPNNAGVFEADGVTGGLNEETGYELASAILSANPQIEYWMVISGLELYAQGTTRVAESLGIDDHTLISCVDVIVLSAAWESGYEGCWVSALGNDPIQFAAPAACGIVSLINGTSTPETLWSHMRAPNDERTFYQVSHNVLTIDTYKDYFAQVRAEAGLG